MWSKCALSHQTISFAMMIAWIRLGTGGILTGGGAGAAATHTGESSAFPR